MSLWISLSLSFLVGNVGMTLFHRVAGGFRCGTEAREERALPQTLPTDMGQSVSWNSTLSTAGPRRLPLPRGHNCALCRRSSEWGSVPKAGVPGSFPPSS